MIFFSDSSESNGLETIGLFLIVAFRSLPGIAKLSSTIQTFVFLKPTLDILDSEFKKNSKISKNLKIIPKKIPKVLFKKKIEFLNVSYFFNKKEPLLDKIHLKINKGSKVGVVGESGSGKSTFVHLILGLLDPNKGKIKIDGTILNKSNKTSGEQILVMWVRKLL